MRLVSNKADADDERERVLDLADRGEACPSCLCVGFVSKVRDRVLPPFRCQLCGHRWRAIVHFPKGRHAA